LHKYILYLINNSINQIYLIMRKLTFLLALLCASVMGAYAIDWSGYEYLGDGAGGGAYSNKYKVAPADGQSVVNIQQPGWASEPGIYTSNFGGAISSCSLGDKCAIDGGGIVLYLSAFTAKETEVTVVAALGTKTFTVYYEDGTEGGGGSTPEPEPDPEPAGINWDEYSWIGNGSGNAAYTDAYKMTLATGQSYVNIQQPGWASEAGIYTTFPAGISSCSLPAGKYAIDGAGMVLYMSAFTAKETEVTVTHGTGTAVFTVYYKNGTEGGAPTKIYDVNFALASEGSSATASTGTAGNAIDGNEGTRWESAATDDETWTLDMGQLRIFNTIKIKWEGAYCKEFELTCSNDGETWSPLYTETNLTQSGWQLIELSDEVTAQYIKYHGTKRATGWGQSFWEFQVLLPGVSVLTSIDLTAAGAITALGGAGMVMTATPKDQNGQAMEAAVSYEITPAAAGHMDGNTFIPDQVGNASIRAYNGEVYSNAVVVAVYEGTNVALNKGDDDITASGYDTGANLYPRFAVDDNDGSLWSARVGETGDERIYDAWIAVDLGAYYNINLIAIRWEGACSKHYHVDFSANGTDWRTAYNAGWDAVATHWEYLIGTGEDATKVKYVRVWSTEAVSQYGTKIMALQVYGTEWVDTGDTEAPVMTSASLASCSYHKAVIAVAATDNHEVARFHVVDAANSIDANFVPDANGNIFLDVNESTEYHLTVTAIDAANNESTGLLVEFTSPAMGNDLALNKPVEASGEDPAWPASNAVIENDALWWSAFVGETGAERVYDAWLSVDLGGFYDINKISIRWEGACSKHYRVEFSANKTDWRVAYLGGHNAVATHWEEFMDTEEDNTKVRYVRVFSTEAVSQYGIKIMALRVYGVPWVPTGDAENPVMVSAALVSNNHNSAIISVEATDDTEVVKYHVVDAGNSVDAEFAPTDGKITVTGLNQQTAYHFTITAIDAAANESENSKSVDVTTSAYNTVPTVAAPVPTWPAAQVKSIYSDAYAFAPASLNSYNEGWWDNPNMNEGNIEGDHYLHYDLYRNGMIGWQYGEISVASLEKLHIDIFASKAGSVTIRPITVGGPNTPYELNLAANQWNSFDIALSEFAGHDWTKLFQFAIETYQAGGLVGEHISVDNVYFYRETAIEDDEKPTNVSASAQAFFYSLKLTVSAEDNSGDVHFVVMNGENQVAVGDAVSGVATTLMVNNLTPGTDYSLNVIASDAANNEADPVAVNATTLALPGAAPAPTHEAKAVKSIYSEAYESAIPVAINFNEWWWQSPTIAQEVSLGGNNARYYGGLNTNGVFGITWSGDHKLDAAGYQKVHFHIYPTNSATIEIYPVIAPEGEFHKVSQELVGGQWNEVVLDYSEKTFAPFNQFGVVYTEALGDFFIDNLYFFSDPDYSRDGLTVGNYGTICLPQAGEIVGATLFEIADYANGMIYVDEVEGGVMDAGKPYIFQATSAQLNVYYTSNVEVAAGENNGLHGFYNLEDENAQFDIPADAGNYILYQNQYWLVSGRAAYIANYRAYIRVSEINYVAPAPGRRRVAMNVNGEQTATGINELNAAEAPVKMIMNGQLYILRGEKLYDATGRLVK